MPQNKAPAGTAWSFNRQLYIYICVYEFADFNASAHIFLIEILFYMNLHLISPV